MDCIKKRRAEFQWHVGELVELKRQYVRRMKAEVATLVGVNRTRAVVQLSDAPLRLVHKPNRFLVGIAEEHLEPEQWTVPLDWLLLPGCLESDPRQMPLFGQEAAQ